MGIPGGHSVKGRIHRSIVDSNPQRRSRNRNQTYKLGMPHRSGTKIAAVPALTAVDPDNCRGPEGRHSIDELLPAP